MPTLTPNGTCRACGKPVALRPLAGEEGGRRIRLNLKATKRGSVVVGPDDVARRVGPVGGAGHARYQAHAETCGVRRAIRDVDSAPSLLDD